MNATPIAIAHRGDPITQRENTLAAFAAAVQEGADMVELDLRGTRDGEIVVLHDANLSRLWGVDKAVADLDLAALSEIGQGEVRVPDLSRSSRRHRRPAHGRLHQRRGGRGRRQDGPRG